MPEEISKKIIVNVDDFGISKLANVNILKLIRKGKVDRVSVMIGPNLDPEDVSEILASGAKIDIHLHLVDQDSDYWQGNRRLREGVVKRVIFFLLNYLFRKTSAEKVSLKWAIQIEEFRKLFGRLPDGVGSHEYIHFFPPYFGVILKLGKNYSIPYIRFGKMNFKKDDNIAKILNWLRKYDLWKFKKSGLDSSDFLVSLDWVEDDLDTFKKNIPNGFQVELVLHPEREEELEILEKFEF